MPYGFRALVRAMRLVFGSLHRGVLVSLLPLDPGHRNNLLQVRLDFYHKLLISRIINGGNGTDADRWSRSGSRTGEAVGRGALDELP